MPELYFKAEYQPFVNTLGDTSSVQMNRAGKGYSMFKPSAPAMFTDAPNDGVSMPPEARHAFISIKGGGIRARTDGTNPSGSSGLYIPPGSLLTFETQAQTFQQFRFVDSQGETSEVTCMWFC